ncbi:MAG: DUF2141 domain-containing protein, partial [Flavobacteriales bacterium]|nr:DUF2141 domain-containing protein [Flavobacteriales bacterium]
GQQFMSKDLKVTKNTMEVVIENIPAGTYACVVFQDGNSNEELDSNFVGFPTEPIGFANDARIKLGPPDFEDVAITITSGQTTVVNIVLR